MKIPPEFLERPQKIMKLLDLQNDIHELSNSDEASKDKTLKCLLPDCPKRAAVVPLPSESRFDPSEPRYKRSKVRKVLSEEDRKIKRAKDKRRKAEKFLKKKALDMEALMVEKEVNGTAKSTENPNKVDDMKENQPKGGFIQKQYKMPKLKEFREFIFKLSD